MPSAEQQLKDAWKAVAGDHASHEPTQVMGIENTSHRDDGKGKTAIDPTYVVRCSCGDFARVSMQAVLDELHKPAPTPEEPKSAKK